VTDKPRRGRPKGPATTHTAFRLTVQDLEALDRIARVLQEDHGSGDRTRAIRWAIHALDYALTTSNKLMPPP
jgi:hypothetical protein